MAHCAPKCKMPAEISIYKAIKPKGHRRLLHGSAPLTLMAQKDMQAQGYRFSKFQFRIFEKVSKIFRNSKVQKTCLDAL